MPRKIEISHRTIIFTVLFLISLWILYFIRDILLLLFVALLIMATLNPLVTRLAKLKIPRALSVLLAYLIVIALVAVAIGLLIPPLVNQTSNFANDVLIYVEDYSSSSSLAGSFANEVVIQMASLPAKIGALIVSVFSNVLAIFTVMVFAFYLLLARDSLDDQFDNIFGKKKAKEYSELIDLLEIRLGGWARGQIALMVLVASTTYIGLVILGIPFALPLAILAGLFEIIPYIGPILAAIPAVIIGLGMSPLMGLATAALYILIQQIENYVFVPKVMQKSAGVNPVITLLALAIGFKIAGIVGVLISIPVVIMIQVLLRKYFFTK